MARYRLPAGRVVSGDVETQIHFPVTRETRSAVYKGDELIAPAEHQTALEPFNVIVGRLTPDERASAGIAEIVESPRPDDRCGFVNEDPEHPGRWIVSPLPPEVHKQRLASYAAGVRFNKEIGGIIVAGARIATDRQSQATMSGAFNFAQMNSDATVNWKQPDGTFAALGAGQIAALAHAVAAHVQACFSTEAAVASEIAAGTVATYEAVDAAFEAIVT